jgi:hypothetical protein
MSLKVYPLSPPKSWDCTRPTSKLGKVGIVVVNMKTRTIERRCWECTNARGLYSRVQRTGFNTVVSQTCRNRHHYFYLLNVALKKRVVQRAGADEFRLVTIHNMRPTGNRAQSDAHRELYIFYRSDKTIGGQIPLVPQDPGRWINICERVMSVLHPLFGIHSESSKRRGPKNILSCILTKMTHSSATVRGLFDDSKPRIRDELSYWQVWAWGSWHHPRVRLPA